MSGHHLCGDFLHVRLFNCLCIVWNYWVVETNVYKLILPWSKCITVFDCFLLAKTKRRKTACKLRIMTHFDSFWFRGMILVIAGVHENIVVRRHFITSD
jgi:hypothetical protein